MGTSRNKANSQIQIQVRPANLERAATGAGWSIRPGHNSTATAHLCPGPPGRLSALSVFLCKSVLYGAFVWACRAVNSQKRRFRPGQSAAANAATGAARRRRWRWGPASRPSTRRYIARGGVLCSEAAAHNPYTRWPAPCHNHRLMVSAPGVGLLPDEPRRGCRAPRCREVPAAGAHSYDAEQASCHTQSLPTYKTACSVS
jgi:hypothetical protein